MGEVELPYWESVLRLVIAVFLGGLLGYEREQEDKPAGLRTHMLVALGACASSLAVAHVSLGMSESEGLGADPTRVVQGIMGGLGFLGAGSIIQSGGRVEGITTAATIWVVGALGVCCGLGAYVIGGTVAALAYAILKIVGIMENKYLDDRRAAENFKASEAEQDDQEKSS